MPNVYSRNKIQPGKYNDYLIAGNQCNAFALGEIGSTEDFFLVGCEPPEESTYPLLTGNILDSEGKVLFRLVRNVLVFNPGHCSRIMGNHVGYEIHDGNGVPVFKVETLFQEKFITTISAKFYNKDGTLIFKANSGEEDERIEASCKCAFGYSGALGIAQGMNREDLEFLAMVFSSGGRVHEPIRGLIEGKEFSLDGKAVIDANVKNCTIHIESGDFLTKDTSYDTCKFIFSGRAANIRNLLKGVDNS